MIDGSFRERGIKLRGEIMEAKKITNLQELEKEVIRLKGELLDIQVSFRAKYKTKSNKEIPKEFPKVFAMDGLLSSEPNRAGIQLGGRAAETAQSRENANAHLQRTIKKREQREAHMKELQNELDSAIAVGVGRELDNVSNNPTYGIPRSKNNSGVGKRKPIYDKNPRSKNNLSKDPNTSLKNLENKQKKPPTNNSITKRVNMVSKKKNVVNLDTLMYEAETLENLKWIKERIKNVENTAQRKNLEETLKHARKRIELRNEILSPKLKINQRIKLIEEYKKLYTQTKKNRMESLYNDLSKVMPDTTRNRQVNRLFSGSGMTRGEIMNSRWKGIKVNMNFMKLIKEGKLQDRESLLAYRSKLPPSGELVRIDIIERLRSLSGVEARKNYKKLKNDISKLEDPKFKSLLFNQLRQKINKGVTGSGEEALNKMAAGQTIAKHVKGKQSFANAVDNKYRQHLINKILSQSDFGMGSGYNQAQNRDTLLKKMNLAIPTQSYGKQRLNKVLPPGKYTKSQLTNVLGIQSNNPEFKKALTGQRIREIFLKLEIPKNKEGYEKFRDNWYIRRNTSSRAGKLKYKELNVNQIIKILESPPGEAKFLRELLKDDKVTLSNFKLKFTGAQPAHVVGGQRKRKKVRTTGRR